MITLLSRCFIPAAKRLQGWWRSWWPEIWFPAFVAHQIRPHPGGSDRLEPSRVIGDLGDAMVLHNLLIHKYNRRQICRSISISQHVVFITITKKEKDSLTKKKKKTEQFELVFFLKQQITKTIFPCSTCWILLADEWICWVWFICFHTGPFLAADAPACRFESDYCLLILHCEHGRKMTAKAVWNN